MWSRLSASISNEKFTADRYPSGHLMAFSIPAGSSSLVEVMRCAAPDLLSASQRLPIIGPWRACRQDRGSTAARVKHRRRITLLVREVVVGGSARARAPTG